jgi:uncharacterized iron-regulated membrane protein
MIERSGLHARSFSVDSTAPMSGSPRLYARFWRWHFFAAFIVIPFVLWQSVTGTIYLWSERWMDTTHPELRFVTADGPVEPPSAQIRAALRAVSGSPPAASAALNDGVDGQSHAGHHGTASLTRDPVVQEILIPEDPHRSTTVLLQEPSGLPFPVFVNPYGARVLGTLSTSAWLPGVTRALHGGWPLGAPESWLLELGDGWAIVMVATGLYLWWPRGRGIGAGLWPRVHSGARVLVRDLHSCVAIWFSIVLMFFLITALPWTAFWGAKILPVIEQATHETSPAGFSTGGASISQMTTALPAVDEIFGTARKRAVPGTLDIKLSPWAQAPLLVTNVHAEPSQDRTVLGEAASGRLLGDFRSRDLPAIPQFVAFGIHVHQGDFGLPSLWLNTAFAASLVWLSVTGVVSWWIRRPRGRLAPPPPAKAPPPRWVLVSAITVCLILPLLGASVLCIVLADRALWPLFRPSRVA